MYFFLGPNGLMEGFGKEPVYLLVGSEGDC